MLYCNAEVSHRVVVARSEAEAFGKIFAEFGSQGAVRGPAWSQPEERDGTLDSARVEQFWMTSYPSLDAYVQQKFVEGDLALLSSS